MTWLVNTTIHIIAQLKWRVFNVKSSIYVDFNKENNKEDPKFEVDDHVKISKYKNKFQKVTLQIGLRKCSLLTRLKILYSGHILLVILTVKKLLQK